MTTDIPIKYINATTRTDFDVVVFTKNFSVNTPKAYYCAWQVLKTQTNAHFVYPVDVAVGATYTSGGQQIIIGPYEAEPGSTWEISQESATDTAVVKKSKTNNLLLSYIVDFIRDWCSCKPQ